MPRFTILERCDEESFVRGLYTTRDDARAALRHRLTVMLNEDPEGFAVSNGGPAYPDGEADLVKMLSVLDEHPDWFQPDNAYWSFEILEVLPGE